MIVSGRTNKEIAAALRVSVRTVEGHRRIVPAKMDVASAAQQLHRGEEGNGSENDQSPLGGRPDLPDAPTMPKAPNAPNAPKMR